MKKVISILLSVLFVLTLLPAAFAAEETSGALGDSITWSFDEAAGKLTVSGTGVMPAFSMNEQYTFVHPWDSLADKITALEVTDGITVLAGSCFENLPALKTAKLADSITDLGFSAFGNCAALEEVNLPAKLESLKYTFAGCASLKQIMVIPATCKLISTPFAESGVETVILPAEMKDIPAEALRMAGGVKTVLVADGVETFGRNALAESGIKNLILPESVNKLGDEMCRGCADLAYVSLPDAVTVLPFNSFGACPALKTIHLPEKLEKICDSAFNWCTSLESITIPATVTEIEPFAFNGCSGLKDVYFTGTEEQWKTVNVGSDNDALLNATVHFNAEADKNITVAGDYDGDGKVTAADARGILRVSVSLETVEAASRVCIACDINLDGALTAADARSALRFSVGLFD